MPNVEMWFVDKNKLCISGSVVGVVDEKFIYPVGQRTLQGMRIH